ncbi:hypothetical protein B0H17DRAFT_1339851 [Mycena rosella]|uniref:RRM domain-containing protein n=1 Tax=Mycena rosella TaxID=1033263 RepID=A0AAD7FM11_MYCRO|nr:hypothetical protein B0H17DRAFT_1339851 [Mycena rosella]
MENVPLAPAEPMDVDSGTRGTKLAAENAPEEGHKKARMDTKFATTLKRDRENSTVFVTDLPSGVTEEGLTALFKDCGKVREVKITELSGAIVATVEFFERDSVPAGLTKDKKRLRDQEITVNLGWKSTLYVTNDPSPESELVTLADSLLRESMAESRLELEVLQMDDNPDDIVTLAGTL